MADEEKTHHPALPEPPATRPEGTGAKLKRDIIHGGYRYFEGEKAPKLTDSESERLKRIGAL